MKMSELTVMQAYRTRIRRKARTISFILKNFRSQMDRQGPDNHIGKGLSLLT